MSRRPYSFGLSRRTLLSGLAVLPVSSGTFLSVSASAQTAPSADLLPSWNDGSAKQAIFDFVRATIDRSNPNYVSTGGPRRGVRPGRHALGGTPHVYTSGLLPGARPRGSGEETRAQERRAVQDLALRQPRGD